MGLAPAATNKTKYITFPGGTTPPLWTTGLFPMDELWVVRPRTMACEPRPLPLAVLRTLAFAGGTGAHRTFWGGRDGVLQKRLKQE